MILQYTCSIYFHFFLVALSLVFCIVCCRHLFVVDTCLFTCPLCAVDTCLLSTLVCSHVLCVLSTLVCSHILCVLLTLVCSHVLCVLSTLVCSHVLFIWPLYCLSCDLRFMITPLVSSSFFCFYSYLHFDKNICDLYHRN